MCYSLPDLPAEECGRLTENKGILAEKKGDVQIHWLEFPEFCFPWFSPEAEAELEILGFVFFEIEALFVREEKVIEPIGYGVVEERRGTPKNLLETRKIRSTRILSLRFWPR